MRTYPETDDTGERGGAAGVEVTLVWVALLALIGAVVQVALVFYAGQLALTAAQDGVNGGRRTSTADGTRAAQSFLHPAAGSALADTTITVQRDDAAGVVRVRVTGQALSLVPGITMTVDKSAVGSIEQVTP